jgi:hypothetical protein
MGVSRAERHTLQHSSSVPLVAACHAQEVTAAREPVSGLDPGVDGEMAQDAATPCVLVRAGSACCAVLEYPAVHLLYTALQSEGTIECV